MFLAGPRCGSAGLEPSHPCKREVFHFFLAISRRDDYFTGPCDAIRFHLRALNRRRRDVGGPVRHGNHGGSPRDMFPAADSFPGLSHTADGGLDLQDAAQIFDGRR
jgi:hypothetical protein